MAPPPGPYSGTSTLALVARVSAFSLGLVYGSVKLKYLQFLILALMIRYSFIAWLAVLDILCESKNLVSWDSEFQRAKTNLQKKSFLSVLSELPGVPLSLPLSLIHK
ncbi:hypothetical protein POTOM_034837 [Populus tomentosa]|uniref:Uncharacterized protein n=1 Tax=Populus tomentosa TaxID=118781 RepID=A0A8X7Z1Y4_POPTO|nr:hypothetical protein POTOM_034837 [Populus tomentosa]